MSQVSAPTASTASPKASGSAPPCPPPVLSRWRGRLWAVLALAGAVVPWWWNVQYFWQGGSIRPQVFWMHAMANPLTTAITLDVYLAALTFAVWVLTERRVRRPWWYVAVCFGVGLACALPWYVLRRQPDAPPLATGGPGAS